MDAAETYECTTAYEALVNRLKARMFAGDDEAAMIIAAMALLITGWRCGDPDPVDQPDDPDPGDKVVILSRLMRAA